ERRSRRCDIESAAQCAFGALPFRWARERFRRWHQAVDRGNPVVVTTIPLQRGSPQATAGAREGKAQQLELVGGNFGRKRLPAIAIPQQHQKVGARRQALTPRDLLKADRHRTLVAARLLADAPAQIDRLEPAAARPTNLPQLGKDLLMKRIPL